MKHRAEAECAERITQATAAAREHLRLLAEKWETQAIYAEPIDPAFARVLREHAADLRAATKGLA